MAPLLSINGITLRRDDGTGSAILNDLSLDVEEGEVVIIKGESGSGKTTFLKCIAELIVFQKGEIKLRDKLSTEYGIPKYRTLVQYVPQRPSLLPGTPLDFLKTVQSFSARQRSSASSTTTINTVSNSIPSTHQEHEDHEAHAEIDPLELASAWGIPKVLWTREWATLSGGEGQRIALAIAVGIGGAEVVLLDEPTSALDAESMKKVEQSLISMLPRRPQDGHDSPRKGYGPKALVWITHEAAQAERVGTRVVDITRR